ncbi:MAG: hypothetical protein ACQKBU_04010 [Verrucomicrobiales bacterium]
MILRFDDGALLKGTLEQMDETSLLWDSPVFPAPQRLSTERLMELSAPSIQDLEQPEGDHLAVVTLTNEDEIRGTLQSVTDEEIRIQTSFGGHLTFRRDMVARLSIEDRPEVIYQGPQGPDDWTPSEEDGWIYKDGQLICQKNSSVSRDIGELNRFRILLDLSWHENARFRLYLHADHPNLDEVGNCYELVCQSQYAYLRKRTRTANRTETTTVGTTGGIRELQELEKIRLELLQDRSTGRVRLKMGGRTIADWTEQAPDQNPMGSFVHFLGDMSGAVAISRIRVTTWDGVVEGEWQDRRAGMGFFMQDELSTENEELTRPAGNGILLRNGDILEGETLGIEEGRVRLKTEFSEFELPVSRLKTFALRTEAEANDPELCWKPIRRKNDVRGFFPDGGGITFELIECNGETLKGRSQTFGEADFLLEGFSRIEFNLYDPDRR